MVTIDPRTSAVGPGPGGRGVALVVVAAALGLAASGLCGWSASFESRDDDDEDDEYVCADDADGEDGCAPDRDSQPGQPRFGRFDATEANGPAEDVARAAEERPVLDDDVDRILPREGADSEPLRVELVAMPEAPARAAGATSCIFQDSRGARAAWERLAPSERPLLERFCRSQGIVLP